MRILPLVLKFRIFNQSVRMFNFFRHFHEFIGVFDNFLSLFSFNIILLFSNCLHYLNIFRCTSFTLFVNTFCIFVVLFLVGGDIFFNNPLSIKHSILFLLFPLNIEVFIFLNSDSIIGTTSKNQHPKRKEIYMSLNLGDLNDDVQIPT